jgi:hypothetical protein
MPRLYVEILVTRLKASRSHVRWFFSHLQRNRGNRGREKVGQNNREARANTKAKPKREKARGPRGAKKIVGDWV